jgi:hypothetical protein
MIYSIVPILITVIMLYRIITEWIILKTIIPVLYVSYGFKNIIWILVIQLERWASGLLNLEKIVLIKCVQQRVL